jgi:hypothetical protein
LGTVYEVISALSRIPSENCKIVLYFLKLM